MPSTEKVKAVSMAMGCADGPECCLLWRMHLPKDGVVPFPKDGVLPRPKRWVVFCLKYGVLPFPKDGVLPRPKRWVVLCLKYGVLPFPKEGVVPCHGFDGQILAGRQFSRLPSIA
jgi:hypothetical protein